MDEGREEHLEAVKMYVGEHQTMLQGVNEVLHYWHHTSLDEIIDVPTLPYNAAFSALKGKTCLVFHID